MAQHTGLWATRALPQLEHSAVDVGFQANEQICSAGDPIHHYGIVIDGCIRKFNMISDGRRHICEFLLPGDMLGIDGLGIAPCSAEAVSPTTVRRYPKALLDAHAAQDSSLRIHLRALTIMSLHDAYRRTLLLGCRNAVERVASFLLEMNDRLARRNSLRLPMGRTDIADYLGLTIATVSRVLTQLAQSATIDLSRGSIDLLDRASLCAQAGYFANEDRRRAA